MRLLMLSGNSLHNRDWILTAQQHFSGLFDGIYVQQYRHWTSGESWINLAHELDALRNEAAASGSEVAVFAKSIGSVLAVQAIEKRLLQPDWLLLCGLPYGYIVKNYPEFAQILASFYIPITVIHNQHDPVGEAKVVKAYLAPSFVNRHDYTFIEPSGETHEYDNFELLRSQLKMLRDSNGNSRDR